MKRYNSSKIGDVIIILIFLVLIMVCLFPVMNVFSRAMSSPLALVRREVGIWPIGLNFDAFSIVWSDAKYPRSLAWTAILTAICTVVSLTLTVLCAYPFVFKELQFRKTLNTMMIFTMYFGAGMIPNFLLMRSLGLIDHPLVLILPGALSIFNMILMRSFFYGIPDSLRESAQIDGAGPIKMLLTIYLPLSKPVMATISLFYAVGRWNGYGDALLYMRAERRYDPIQLLLYRIQQGLQGVDSAQLDGAPTGLPEAARTATIVIAMVPILIVYPFIQKYFVAGATLGAIKE